MSEESERAAREARDRALREAQDEARRREAERGKARESKDDDWDPRRQEQRQTDDDR